MPPLDSLSFYKIADIKFCYKNSLLVLFLQAINCWLRETLHEEAGRFATTIAPNLNFYLIIIRYTFEFLNVKEKDRRSEHWFGLIKRF